MPQKKPPRADGQQDQREKSTREPQQKMFNFDEHIQRRNGEENEHHDADE